jgi:DNA-binding XRE family transcriptional regulator
MKPRLGGAVGSVGFLRIGLDIGPIPKKLWMCHTLGLDGCQCREHYNMNDLDLLEKLAAQVKHDAIKRDLAAVGHKLRFPMMEILRKVPGDTIAAKSRAVGVSRQTWYVWGHERFRPSSQQAAIIAELTGVPAEQIAEYQEGKNEGRGNGAGKSPRKKVARLAKASRSLPSGAARLRAKRTGVGLKPGKRRYDRKVVKRTPRGLGGGKSD